MTWHWRHVFWMLICWRCFAMRLHRAMDRRKYDGGTWRGKRHRSIQVRGKVNHLIPWKILDVLIS